MAADPVERLLSPEDVARLCGLSRRAVYDAIKRGELGAFRLCSRLRISMAQLEAWLNENAVSSAAPHPQPAPTVEPSPERLAQGSFRARLAARRTARA